LALDPASRKNMDSLHCNMDFNSIAAVAINFLNLIRIPRKSKQFDRIRAVVSGIIAESTRFFPMASPSPAFSRERAG
jgi:hypothetical protein